MAAAADTGGWAPALHHCPHVKDSIGPCNMDSFPVIRTTEDCVCSVDGCDQSESWVCLKCCEVFCGRYGNAHMLAHFNADNEHCIALGIGDLSFWCYRCDSYLDHLTIRPIFEVYKVAHAKKFGTEIPEDLARSTHFGEHETFMDFMEPIDEDAELSDGVEDADGDEKKEDAIGSHLDDVSITKPSPTITSASAEATSASAAVTSASATEAVAADGSDEDAAECLLRKRDPELNPLTKDGTAAVRRVGTSAASTALSAEDRVEMFEEREELQKKARLLAMCIRASRHSVVHTGAGISTAAKIPDYRGPKGVWTMAAEGKSVKMEISLEQAAPTFSHMALKAMVDSRLLAHVVTTNVDGLHRRSGIARKYLSELHGDIYLEYCNSCGKEYLRTFDVTKTRVGPSRFTGRKCEVDSCTGDLRDSIIAFGENLPKGELTSAMRETASAELVIVMGSSMRVSPSCNIPSLSYHKKGTFVLVNLQKTPYDKFAHIRVHANCDEFMRMVCDELALEVEDFDVSTIVAAHERETASFLLDAPE